MSPGPPGSPFQPPGQIPAASPPMPAAHLTAGAIPILPVQNQHSMTTRAKHGFRVPALYHAAPLSLLPRTYRAALAGPNWRAAMEEEFSALAHNNIWDLVPRPFQANVVSGKWIFKHKLCLETGLYSNWMSRTLSSMATCLRLFIQCSLLGLKIQCIPVLYAT